MEADNGETLFLLDKSDVESAIRQFICSCHPERTEGCVVNPAEPGAESFETVAVSFHAVPARTHIDKHGFGF